MIAILMGVMGTGKTTVAKELQAVTGWEYAEGDDFHTEEKKAKMRAAIPLTDEDRWPWLDRLHAVLKQWQDEGKSGILTCSALKQSYRDRLVAGLRAGSAYFVLLEVPKEELERRLASRKGHYMNPGLLESQFASLEEPKDALRVDATGNETQIAERVLAALHKTA